MLASHMPIFPGQCQRAHTKQLFISNTSWKKRGKFGAFTELLNEIKSAKSSTKEKWILFENKGDFNVGILLVIHSFKLHQTSYTFLKH